MAQANDQVVLCSTCKQELDSSIDEARPRKVIVGIQSEGPLGPHRWIVRAYCAACAEQHYHHMIYGQDFHV